MGIFSEYITRQLTFEQLESERKQQLRRIAKARGREILVYAADLSKSARETSIEYADLLPISDQLANLTGKSIDVLLETPGGDGAVTEDIVRTLRNRFESVAFIVPGWAKSAGTIMVAAGDEILMGPDSALGPIDAQLAFQGKVFSAEALLEGLKKIKDEVEDTKQLNKAYIPILQNLSPGDIQHAENSLAFAKALVRDWLANYKFKVWETHSSTGLPVTDDERRKRAEEIAAELCSHTKWLTHSKSIRLEDLRRMRLLITDYSESAELSDAITRYHVLLRITFSGSVGKLVETVQSQVYRHFVSPPQQVAALPGSDAQKTKDGGNRLSAKVTLPCPNCSQALVVQADLDTGIPLEVGAIPFPKSGRINCPTCQAPIDLSPMKADIEKQTGKKIVFRDGKKGR